MCLLTVNAPRIGRLQQPIGDRYKHVLPEIVRPSPKPSFYRIASKATLTLKTPAQACVLAPIRASDHVGADLVRYIGSGPRGRTPA